jgi:hypothetical protein
MSGIQHTFHAMLAGYESMEITINVRLTPEQLVHMQAAGRPPTPIVDFPNWEIAAPICGLCRMDPETGEMTDEALCKPAFPLTWADVDRWPNDFSGYVIGRQGPADGLADYIRHAHPNLRAG